jgi:hypothetical protein
LRAVVVEVAAEVEVVEEEVVIPVRSVSVR